MSKYHPVSITVVVPVYRVEAYVVACVQSIIAQTHTDFECLLIDDASPDRSIPMAQSHTQHDTRFRVIHHPRNLGPGAARNTGISHAQGEYICFIDSDDTIDPSFLKTLYTTLIEHDADLCACGFYYGPEHDQKIHQVNIAARNWQEGIKKIFNTEDVSYLCRRLFRTSLFEKVRFIRGNYEDTPTYIHLLLENKVGYIPFVPQPLYHYYTRKSSLTNTMTEEFVKEYVQNLLVVTKAYLVRYGTYDRQRDHFCHHYLLKLATHFIKFKVKKGGLKGIARNLLCFKREMEAGLQEELDYLRDFLARSGDKKQYMLFYHFMYNSRGYWRVLAFCYYQRTMFVTKAYLKKALPKRWHRVVREILERGLRK